jgi:acyl carrier protein
MNVEERVIKVTACVLGIKWHSDIDIESNFSNDLGADSLDTLELVMSLEDEFDIVIDDTNVANIHTVKETINYIKDLLEPKTI